MFDDFARKQIQKTIDELAEQAMLGTSTASTAPNSTLTWEHVNKVMDEMKEKFPEPSVSAILFTDNEYLIPPGTLYKADYEGKRYILCSKAEIEKLKTETFRPAKEVTTYQAGFAGFISFTGIPVIEDSEKIKKIFEKAIQKYLAKFEEDLFKPRPFTFEEPDNEFRFNFRFR